MAKRKTTHYLNNHDLLKEIFKSKASFSEYTDDKYAVYDLIVEGFEFFELPFNDEKIEYIKEQRRATMVIRMSNTLVDDGISRRQANKVAEEDTPLVASMAVTGTVIRVLTKDHVPNTTNNKGKVIKEPTNFAPFQHLLLDDDHSYKIVGKSHWVGGMSNGHFDKTRGRVTENLGRMFYMLAERYGQNGNYRNYTFLDEMKSTARVQLSQGALLFNEFKGDNPFAYYTKITDSAFKSVLNSEKKLRDIRDSMMVAAGYNPSFSKSIEFEMAMKEEVRLNENHNKKLVFLEKIKNRKKS